MSFLILCAIESELKPICAALTNVEKLNSNFYRTKTASGEELLLASSGLGSLHAACCLTELACQYKLSGVLLLGVGGGLRSGLEAGVLVIGDKILQHDSLAVLNDGIFFMRPGSAVVSREAGEKHDPFYRVDEDLKTLCLAGSASVSAVVGTIVCGGEFSGTYQRKLELASLAGSPLLVEMEAGGVATAASRLNIPFAVAKGVADRLKPPLESGSVFDDYRRTFIEAMTGSVAIARYVQKNR